MKERLRRTFDVILILAVLAIVAWAASAYVMDKKEDAQSRVELSSAVRVSVDDGSNPPVVGKTAASGTVLDATRAFASETGIAFETKAYPGLGVLVTRIGGSKNGAGGAYWQYWVNGNYATSSADSVSVSPEDRIEWRFSGSEQ